MCDEKFKQKQFELARDKTDCLYDKLSDEIKRNPFFKEFTTSYAEMVRLETEIKRGL